MRVIRSVLVLFVLACPSQPSAQQPRPSPPAAHTLLAVFAHPDDESMAGALLAEYGHQPGVTVHLVFATSGEQGVTPFAGIPAGDALAAVRAREAQCAAAALGARPPILLGFPDGGLSQSAVLADLAAKLAQTIRDLAPDAIVTWGPDGGYGHPDHRLVGAVVTQIVQAGETTTALYYAALPKSGLRPELLAQLRFPAPFQPVADQYLNVRVPYSPTALAHARAALGCHKSQYTPAAMDQLMSLSDLVNRGTAYLRSWNGGIRRDSLF